MISKRKHWIDYLRVIATIAVVNIHVSSLPYGKFGKISNFDWWFANIVSSASRFAVPLFVMISGSVLLGREYDLKTFYAKRTFRLIPPLIFWSLFYILYLDFRYDDGYSLYGITYDILLRGQVFVHLWYLSMIICLMLFAPFINMFITGKKPDRNELKIFIILVSMFLLLNFVSETLYELTDHVQKIQWINRYLDYIGYFILGYYITEYGDKFKFKNITIIILIILFFCLGMLLNYIACDYYNNTRVGLFTPEHGPTVIFLTLFIFYFLRKNADVCHGSQRLLAVSDACFGIYLIHPFFLSLIIKYSPSYYENSILYIPFTTIILFAISFFVIHSVRKLYVGKYIC